MFGTICAVTIVGVYDRFRVAVGVEGVTELLEFFAKLAIVIDFPVEDNPSRSIPIMDWLLTAFEINYGEAAHSQADGPVHVETVVVGTAMSYGSAHPAQQSLIYV